MASIVILKLKNLTIDQRLAVMGFFWNDLDNLIKNDRADEIEELANFYMSPNFLEAKGATIFSEIAFDHKRFLEFVIDCVFKNLYSSDSKYYVMLKKFFMPTIDNSENISIEQAEINFVVWQHKREIFLDKVDTILSNYVAHEIFHDLFPYRIKGSVAHNFAVLVAAYKFVEWNIFTTNFSQINLKRIINFVSEISRHRNFLSKTSSAVAGEEDIKKIISAFLNV